MMPTDRAELRKLAEGATPGPWFYNGYAAIFSEPACDAEEAYWTDERMKDGHTYGHREPCPMCGPREFFPKCVRFTEAYDLEGQVAGVPAHHGDTAIHRHQADAAFIAACDPQTIISLLDALDEAERRG